MIEWFLVKDHPLPETNGKKLYLVFHPVLGISAASSNPKIDYSKWTDITHWAEINLPEEKPTLRNSFKDMDPFFAMAPEMARAACGVIEPAMNFVKMLPLGIKDRPGGDIIELSLKDLFALAYAFSGVNSELVYGEAEKALGKRDDK